MTRDNCISAETRKESATDPRPLVPAIGPDCSVAAQQPAAIPMATPTALGSTPRWFDANCAARAGVGGRQAVMVLSGALLGGVCCCCPPFSLSLPFSHARRLS